MHCSIFRSGIVLKHCPSPIGQRHLADPLWHRSALAGAGPLALAGFSFGAAVTSYATQKAFVADRDLKAIVLVGTAASRFQVAPVPEAWQSRTLVIHGEVDETVPLASVLDWARPQSLPVTVVPGGEHFFHGRLPLLKGLVVRHLMVETETQQLS